MGVPTTHLTLHRFLLTVHFRGSFDMANAALQLFVFVLPTLVAEGKVITERVVGVVDIHTRIDVFLVIVLFGSAAFALEAVLALPLVWDALDLWFKTESMVRPVAESTEHQLVLFSGLATRLTGLAV